jgi:hypothetical protein
MAYDELKQELAKLKQQTTFNVSELPGGTDD